jgi:hypothetical protein
MRAGLENYPIEAAAKYTLDNNPSDAEILEVYAMEFLHLRHYALDYICRTRNLEVFKEIFIRAAHVEKLGASTPNAPTSAPTPTAPTSAPHDFLREAEIPQDVMLSTVLKHDVLELFAWAWKEIDSQLFNFILICPHLTRAHSIMAQFKTRILARITFDSFTSAYPPILAHTHFPLHYVRQEDKKDTRALVFELFRLKKYCVLIALNKFKRKYAREVICEPDAEQKPEKCGITPGMCGITPEIQCPREYPRTLCIFYPELAQELANIGDVEGLRFLREQTAYEFPALIEIRIMRIETCKYLRSINVRVIFTGCVETEEELNEAILCEFVRRDKRIYAHPRLFARLGIKPQNLSPIDICAAIVQWFPDNPFELKKYGVRINPEQIIFARPIYVAFEGAHIIKWARFIPLRNPRRFINSILAHTHDPYANYVIAAILTAYGLKACAR